jgi:hypothetical protein
MTTPEEVLIMQIRIKELAHHESLILDEGDREFILGLNMLMEMQEPIDPRYAERVAQIYQKVEQNAFAGAI